MLNLALKDLRLFFKDRRSMLLTFAIPIALITLFAFAFGGVGKGDGDQKITLLLSDLDQSQASEETIVILDSLPSIHIKLIDLKTAQTSIEKGNEACVLIIHKGFSDSLNGGKNLPFELQYDEAQSTKVALLQQSLIPTIAMLPYNIGNPKETMSHRILKMTGNSNTTIQKEIQQNSDHLFDLIAQGISENPSENKSNSSNNFFGGDIKMTKIMSAKNENNVGLIQAVAGTSVMMLLFSVVGIGMGLLDEKQEGTLKRLLYAPLNPTKILLGKLIAANVISILQLLIMFIFASLAFGLNITSHLPELLITIIATAFACSAFGVFIASFAKSRQQVQGLSTLIILVMSAIGGSMIPLFFMPSIMQKLAVISVNYWSIQGFYDVFWRDLPFYNTTFLSRILVLFLIGLLLNGLAVVLFRRNILKLS